MTSNKSSTADLIFPELSTNFSSTLSALKKSTLSISNRLNSILSDAEFVCGVADTYHLPLVANERCGSWYIPPSRKAGSAYFKSTDGHTGQWSFSLRRLNFQLLDTLEQYHGCIIVDSTRRGKSMPDALSKTVPIWCAVINALLFPEVPAEHAVRTPASAVSPSEHAQIESRLPEFVDAARSLNLDIPSLRAKLSKPLRPFWATQEAVPPNTCASLADYYPVICCTSSRRVHGTEMSEGGYIQGAGDDHEGWAHGMTPPIFWQNKDTLMSTAEDDLPDLISDLLAKDKSVAKTDTAILISPTSWLLVSTDPSPEVFIKDKSHDPAKTAVINIGGEKIAVLETQLKDRYIQVECRTGKLGSRDLRKALPFVLDRITAWRDVNTICINCAEGRDISVGVALAILGKFSNDQGERVFDLTEERISKLLVKQRLSWIMMSCPDAKPSRATLQSVNEVLMSER